MCFFQIFFVDYGNKMDVSLEELLEWGEQFERIPHQAIRFSLGGFGGLHNVAEVYSAQTRATIHGAMVELLTNKVCSVVSTEHQVSVTLPNGLCFFEAIQEKLFTINQRFVAGHFKFIRKCLKFAAMLLLIRNN